MKAIYSGISVGRKILSIQRRGLCQGCQMVYFQTNNANVPHFVGSFNGRWYILWPFGLHILRLFWYFCGNFGAFYGLVYFSRFGMLHHEKSGNPVCVEIVVCDAYGGLQLGLGQKTSGSGFTLRAQAWAGLGLLLNKPEPAG
jgi:hypothetical protein